MQSVLAIAAGGALGAVARHYVGGYVMRLTGMGFPFGTMTVNILGSLLMGVLIELLAVKLNASPVFRAFFAVGVLGGFTTFSTFSLETALLIERGAMMQAALYVGGSVILGVGALFAGLALVRGLA